MDKLDRKHILISFIVASISWLLFLLILVPLFFVFGVMLYQASSLTNVLNTLFNPFFWVVVYVTLLILSLIWIKLSYNNYGYKLDKDDLRIHSGVITKKRISIPYGRIQAVNVYRGIWQRLFGLSSLWIENASMDIDVRADTQCSIPNLKDDLAETLREELVKKSKGERSGLVN